MDPSSLGVVCAPGTRDPGGGARITKKGRLESEQMTFEKGKTSRGATVNLINMAGRVSHPTRRASVLDVWVCILRNRFSQPVLRLAQNMCLG